MSFQEKKRLWNSVYAGATNTTYYTVPDGLGCQIIKIVVTNIDASAAVTLDLFHNVDGETGGDENALALDLSIGPKETKVITASVGIVMESLDKIVALASSASKLTLHGYGVEFTP